MSIGFLFILCQIFGIIIIDSLATQSAESTYRIGSPQERKIPTHARHNLSPFNTTASPLLVNVTTNPLGRESKIYTLYAQKGLKLYTQLLSGCIPDRAKHPTFDDLISSDFDIFPLPLTPSDRSASALLPDILDAIGAGQGKEYFFVNVVDHEETSSYTASYSPTSGLIAAISLSHPPSRSLHSPNSIHWSDIAFALYTHTCTLTSPPTPPSSLTYLIQAYITNDITLSILSSIIPPHKSGIFIFTPEDETPGGGGTSKKGFYALLASPNGVGGVWLLMQHNGYWAGRG